MMDQRNIFVSVTGKSCGDGSFDRPVSLERALEMAADADGATICLFEGVYQLKQALQLGTELSGTEFRALSSDKVFWDGGSEITNWQKREMEFSPDGNSQKREVWTADVSELGEFKFLHINGQLKPRCRYPADAPGEGTKTESRLNCEIPEALLACGELEDCELALFYDWVCRRLKIKSIDSAGMDFVPDMTQRGLNTKFYLENLPLKFLSPGQWKLVENMVYYLPEAGDDFAQLSAFAAITPQLLEVNGNPETGQFVENLIFDGIEFRHTGDGRLINSNQAEQQCSAAICLTGALNCRFDNCGFANTSGWGIEFADGCRGNVVSHCRFEHTGAGGIMANGSTVAGSPGITGDNRFINNKILRGGQVWSGAIGVLLRHSAGNLVSGNEIAHYVYSGISCGWVWGYGENISRDNIIANNHIHHLGGKLLADMGGIYMLGIQPGTIIRGNVIHDIAGSHISWGIYLDEGSSDMVIENNLVYNIASECFHVHYGRDNLVRDNVFATGGTGICSVTRGTMDMKCNFNADDKAFVSERNIMLSSGAPFYVKYLLDYEIKEDMSCMTSDHNVFLFDGDKTPVFGADGFHCFENTFKQVFDEREWQNAGFEEHSLLLPLSGAQEKLKDIEWLAKSTAGLYNKMPNRKGGKNEPRKAN